MSSEMPPKRVDESWKEEVAKERQKLRQAPAAPGRGQQPERGGEPQEPVSEAEATAFANFLLGLRLQALIALGQVPHPATQQLEYQPEQAQYLIDVLTLLQRKTVGNLTPEEQTLFDELLYELRMKFVQATAPPPPPESRHA